MGEWSEYFEDFPEENPANWVAGRFDPQAAKAQREGQIKVSQDQAGLDAEIAGIVKKHSPGSPPSGPAKK
jgi:hypothetical protein